MNFNHFNYILYAHFWHIYVTHTYVHCHKIKKVLSGVGPELTSTYFHNLPRTYTLFLYRTISEGSIPSQSSSWTCAERSVNLPRTYTLFLCHLRRKYTFTVILLDMRRKNCTISNGSIPLHSSSGTCAEVNLPHTYTLFLYHIKWRSIPYNLTANAQMEVWTVNLARNFTILLYIRNSMALPSHSSCTCAEGSTAMARGSTLSPLRSMLAMHP